VNEASAQCGEKIRQAREKQDLLQRELAVRAGLPTRTIGRIERGEVDVRLGTLQKIADALGLKIRDLV
jgi:transcriptional regulator with XRE-family HTH domain